MNWIETPESTTLVGFGYDNATQVLTVEFRNGGTYNYFDVPEQVYEQMTSAASKGQFITSSIKGVYRYARA